MKRDTYHQYLRRWQVEHAVSRWIENPYIDDFSLKLILKEIQKMKNVNIGEELGMEKIKVKIKYHNPDMEHLKLNRKGDWIDLRAAEDVCIKKGDFALISLGVSMKLPDGYEAHIVPRSSTFMHWGIIMANEMGVIDSSYSGTNDVWQFPAIALRDTEIKTNDRICQFRLVRNQQPIDFFEVEELDKTDRGGFGSTGAN